MDTLGLKRKVRRKTHIIENTCLNSEQYLTLLPQVSQRLYRTSNKTGCLFLIEFVFNRQKNGSREFVEAVFPKYHHKVDPAHPWYRAAKYLNRGIKFFFRRRVRESKFTISFTNEKDMLEFIKILTPNNRSYISQVYAPKKHKHELNLPPELNMFTAESIGQVYKPRTKAKYYIEGKEDRYDADLLIKIFNYCKQVDILYQFWMENDINYYKKNGLTSRWVKPWFGTDDLNNLGFLTLYDVRLIKKISINTGYKEKNDA